MECGCTRWRAGAARTGANAATSVSTQQRAACDTWRRDAPPPLGRSAAIERARLAASNAELVAALACFQ
ncbi:MAG: hypothetical protein ACTHMU_10490, partial [Thermomicrobiales bacterium]